MAFAITGITTVLAPIIGPVLGGFITDNYSWRWIFFINVPVGILAAVLVSALLEDPPSARKQKVESIDYIGLGLIALGLGCLQVFLDKGQQEDWFSSGFIILFALLAVGGLILAVLWVLRQEKPVVDLKLLTIPSFGFPCMMMFFIGVALYGGTALLPMMLQENFGYDAITSGLVLSPSGIAVVLVMLIAGRLVNVFQVKYLVCFGMLTTAFGMYLTGLITPQTDYTTFVWVRIFQMIGLPFLFVSVSTLAFSKISAEKSSNASAIISLMRNLGGSIGIAVVTTIVVRHQQLQQSILDQQLTVANPGYRAALSGMTKTLTGLGLPSGRAAAAAMGNIYQQLLHQASVLAFRDAYNFLAAILLVLAGAALFMPGNDPHKKDSPGAAH
jgi:DHA2 family multidrug resistance protein